MKVYVAGIKIDRAHANESTLDKTRHICDLLSAIQEHASILMGDDAVIMVILEEYALTPMAIPAADKRASLALLQQAMSNFDQMILIPGSYSSYEKFHDDKLLNKSEKIKTNYNDLSLRKIVPLAAYDREMLQLNRMSQHHKLANCSFLQNTAYVLTAMEKHRHKKAAPFHESSKFPHAFNKHVYYIGHDDFIKHLSVKGKKIDAGIFICFEHHEIDHRALLMREPAPLLHTLVSAAIDMKTDKLIGALNIQMDKCDGLVVVKNLAHFRADEIEDVIANTYRTGTREAVRVSVIDINKPLPISPPVSPGLGREMPEQPNLKRGREDEKDINTRQYKH